MMFLKMCWCLEAIELMVLSGKGEVISYKPLYYCLPSLRIYVTADHVYVSLTKSLVLLSSCFSVLNFLCYVFELVCLFVAFRLFLVTLSSSLD